MSLPPRNRPCHFGCCIEATAQKALSAAPESPDGPGVALGTHESLARVSGGIYRRKCQVIWLEGPPETTGVTAWLFELPLTVLRTDVVASIFSVP